ncbi:MAG: WHG domain-containing protein [Propionibacteriaceae bacterium]|nr:WHG domain-containing protein [Propionibacteriaceae bacterium]
MPQKRNLTPEIIRRAAVEIIEMNGAQALTMHSLADALGVKSPSLYNHVSGLREVWTMLADEGLKQVIAAVRGAAIGRSADTALREIAYAYRSFGLTRPHLYAAFDSLPRLDSKEVRAASSELVGVLGQVLAVYHLEAEEQTNIIRVLLVGLHGFVSRENAGFFTGPIPADTTFERLIDSWLALLPRRQA